MNTQPLVDSEFALFPTLFERQKRKQSWAGGGRHTKEISMSNPFGCTRRSFVLTSQISALGLLLNGRLRASEPRIVVPSYNTFTDEEEVELGKAFDKKMTEEAAFITQPYLSGYLNEIVQKLGHTSRRPNFRYSIRTIDVAEVNASAVPGGFMYVNRGMLDMVEDESQLVATLAHEVGHVAAHHGTNKLAAIFIGKSFYELVKREVLHDQAVIANVIEKLGGALFLLAQLQYSRSNEADADLLGYYNMMRAGWHPEGMITMFRLLLAHSRDPNLVEAVFSSHPPTSERIQAIERETREAPPDPGLIRNSDQFRQMKAVLRQLPPPRMKSMPR